MTLQQRNPHHQEETGAPSLRLTEDMQAVLDDFSLFDDWEEKYAYLIDLGKKLPPLEPEHQREENKVHGCTSQVWLVHEPRNEDGWRHYFRADSDAYLVKGLIALLLRIYSGKTTEEVERADIERFFHALGLQQYLSPNRSNGFFAMTQAMRHKARQPHVPAGSA